MSIRIIALFAIVLSLASCDNEIDINGPWKETPVIFALIDNGQDSQVFRIQKTYQNDVNKTTSQVAQIADSLVMKNIDVSIINNSTKEERFLKKLAPRKQAGFFSNKDSSYWGESLPGFFNANQSYTLKIKSHETGNTYIAVSNAVEPAVITQIPVDLVTLTQPKVVFRINGGGHNTAIYDLIVRTNYYELPAANPTDTVFKHLDFFVLNGNDNSQTILSFSTTFDKSTFSSFVKTQIPVNESVTRRFASMEYVSVCSNKIYSDMLAINSSSNSVVAKSKDFSNISNGIGIFASQTTSSRIQAVNANSVNLLNTLLNPAP
ncbi:MAG: hypothetical protein V4658_00835 [Bacteroidota bacterium]